MIVPTGFYNNKYLAKEEESHGSKGRRGHSPSKTVAFTSRTCFKENCQTLKKKPASKSQYGYIWEEFLGAFFGMVRTIGKENKINLLNLISFDRLKKLARMQ